MRQEITKYQYTDGYSSGGSVRERSAWPIGRFRFFFSISFSLSRSLWFLALSCRETTRVETRCRGGDGAGKCARNCGTPIALPHSCTGPPFSFSLSLGIRVIVGWDVEKTARQIIRSRLVLMGRAICLRVVCSCECARLGWGGFGGVSWYIKGKVYGMC